MAVRSAEEILTAFRDIAGERTDDDFLGLVEDLTDTLNRPDESEDWKSKYEENDRMWREKYRDRFFSTGQNETESVIRETVVEEKEEPMTFDDLFD